jgi:hypothetical protein
MYITDHPAEKDLNLIYLKLVGMWFLPQVAEHGVERYLLLIPWFKQPTSLLITLVRHPLQVNSPGYISRWRTNLNGITILTFLKVIGW